jgi:Flp pilus assembly protein TadD
MDTAQLDRDLQTAKAKLRRGEIAQAETLYQRVLQVRPTCAEAQHFLGLSAMRRGDLHAALRLVRRSIELQPSRSEYHNNLATILGRLNRPAEALRAAECAIALQPESPEAWNNKGFSLEHLGHVPQAVDSYRNAIRYGGDYTEAMANLGDVLFRLGRYDEAATWLRRVVGARPRNAAAHKKLAVALRRMGQLADAAVAYQAAVDLMPGDADLLNDIGGVCQELGDRPAAETLLRHCLAVNPQHPDGHWNLALALLAMGRWKEGWKEYEWRRRLSLDAGQTRSFFQPAWDGASSVKGKTLLVCSEQGFGDTIQFARYALLLKARGARVVLECQPPLRQLLSSLPGVDGVVPRGDPIPPFDLHVRLMTLPGQFGTEPDSIPWPGPYLHAEAGRQEKFRNLLSADAGLKVGLIWQGRPAHRGDRFRSMRLGLFEPLARIPGVRLVSLQKNPGADQLAADGRRLNLLQWSDPGDVSEEAWADTAAVIKNLDLVIGVDTSVCHLAGAMGVETWLALPKAADWRWLEAREDTRWYPTMRLFRQARLGDWGPVVSAMAAELHKRVRE